MKTNSILNPQPQTSARAATLDSLIENVIPLFLSPPPSRETLRNWFEAAGVPKFKCNPSAKRGGGPCFYSVSAVEKFFRSRLIAG